jgi:type I restriction enzyme S subunit
LKAGWEQKRLGEVCSLINRGVAPKYLETGGIAVLNQKCVRDHEVSFEFGRRHDQKAKKVDPERYVRVGDVLVNSTGTGTLGRVAQVRAEPPEPTTVDTHVTIVRPEEGRFYRDFFGYMLTQIEDEIARSGEGASGQTELARSALQNKFSVSFPTSIPEQQRIVAILDEAFTGLATATANAEKNLKNARELFESYLNSVFAKKGAGWAEGRIGEVCTLQSGTTVDKELERKKGDVPYLKVADMTLEGNEERIISSSRFLNRKDIKPGNVLPVGTTIFPKRGGAILTNKKRLTAVPICADLNIMGVLPSENIRPELVFMYFLAVDMRKLGSGSSIPQINNYDVSPLPIHFPRSKADQKKLVDEFEQYQAAVRGLEDVYEKKIVGLAELKQSILQKAFSGELTAPPSQAIKEAAE